MQQSNNNNTLSNTLSKQQELATTTTGKSKNSTWRAKFKNSFPGAMAYLQTGMVYDNIASSGVTVKENVCVPTSKNLKDYLGFSNEDGNNPASLAFLPALHQSPKITYPNIQAFIAMNEQARATFFNKILEETGRPVADEDSMIPYFAGFKVSHVISGKRNDKRCRLLEFVLATPPDGSDFEEFAERFKNSGEEEEQEFAKELSDMIGTYNRTYKFFAFLEPMKGYFEFENLLDQVCCSNSKFDSMEDYIENGFKAVFADYLFGPPYLDIQGVNNVGQYRSILGVIFGGYIIPGMKKNKRPPQLDAVNAAEGTKKESMLEVAKHMMDEKDVIQIKNQTSFAQLGGKFEYGSLQSFTYPGIVKSINQSQTMKLVNSDGGFRFEQIEHFVLPEKKQKTAPKKKNPKVEVEPNYDFVINGRPCETNFKEICLFTGKFTLRSWELCGPNKSIPNINAPQNAVIGVTGFPFLVTDEKNNECYIQQKFVVPLGDMMDELENQFGQQFKKEYENSLFFDFGKITDDQISVLRYLSVLLDLSNRMEGKGALVCFQNPKEKENEKTKIQKEFFKCFGKKGKRKNEIEIDFDHVSNPKFVKNILKQNQLLGSRCALLSVKLVVGIQVPPEDSENSKKFVEQGAKNMLSRFIKELGNEKGNERDQEILQKILDENLYEATEAIQENCIGVVPYYAYFSKSQGKKDQADPIWTEVSSTTPIAREFWNKKKGAIDCSRNCIIASDGSFKEGYNIPDWLILSQPGKENVIDTYQQAHSLGVHAVQFGFHKQVKKANPYYNLTPREQKKYDNDPDKYLAKKDLLSCPIAYRTIEKENDGRISFDTEYQLSNGNLVFSFGPHIVSQLSAYHLMQALKSKNDRNSYLKKLGKWLDVFGKGKALSTEAVMHFLPLAFVFCKDFLEYKGFYNQDQLDLYDYFKKNYSQNMFQTTTENGLTFIYLNPGVLVSDIYEALALKFEGKAKTKSEQNIESKLGEECSLVDYHVRKFLFDFFNEAAIFVSANVQNEHIDWWPEDIQDKYIDNQDNDTLIELSLQQKSQKEKASSYKERIIQNAIESEKDKTISKAQFKKILKIFLCLVPFGLKGADEKSMIEYNSKMVFDNEDYEDDEDNEDNKNKDKDNKNKEEDDGLVENYESQTIPVEPSHSKKSHSKKRNHEEAFEDQSDDQSDEDPETSKKHKKH